MVRAYITSAMAGAFLLGMATAALAVTGEYRQHVHDGSRNGQANKDRLLHQCPGSRQDLLLRQQGGHDPVHGRPFGQSGEGAGLLRKARKSPVTRLLTNARGPFHLGRALFCCSLYQ